MALFFLTISEELGIRVLCTFFGWCGRPKIPIVFRDEVLSIQRLKSLFLFVHLFWSDTKVFFVDGPTILIHFIDWMGS